MARRLQDNPNTVAPGGNYPYGRAKDNTGSGNGTPVNEQFIGDITQFFERLMGLTGTVANGLPENSSDGFQFITALNAYISSGWVKKIGDTMSGILNMGSNKITNVGTGTTSGDAINYTQYTASNTTLQNNIDGKLASGNVAPDNATVEVVGGVLRSKNTQQVTGSTTVGTGSTTVLTIPTTTNTNFLLRLRLVSKYSGTGGTPGDGSVMERVYAFNNVSGTVTQIGSAATIFTMAQGGTSPEVIATISGTDILVQIRNTSSGPVNSCKVTAFIESI